MKGKTMIENSYLDQILEETEKFGQNRTELFSGEFEVKEIFDLIASLVRVAESVITSPRMGASKHKLVHDAFNWFDQKYEILDRVDDLIPLPFFMEPFDGPVIRKVIDFLISQAVSALNTSIWKEAESVIV